MYSVTYDYNAENSLSAVSLDSDTGGLNRTMTFGYTSVGAETGLLNSITGPLSHIITYAYGAPANNPIFIKIYVQSVRRRRARSLAAAERGRRGRV